MTARHAVDLAWLQGAATVALAWIAWSLWAPELRALWGVVWGG
jgi:hypothetical protein